MSNKKSRILYVVGTLDNGGQERQLYNLVQNIYNDFDIAILVWSFNKDHKYVNDILQLGVKIIQISPTAHIFTKLIKFRQCLISFKPDIIHSYTLSLNIYLWLASIGLNSIKIGGLRSRYWNGFKKKNWPIRLLSGFFPLNKISNNFSGASEISKIYNSFFLPENKIKVVPNGIKTEVLDFQPIIAENEIITASMGSLTEVKRWDQLILILEELKNRNYKFRHIHAGKGKLYNELIKLIEEKNLSSYITFLDNVTDLNKFYKNTRLLIHTAASEGCPNVILEAMACGRAVVSTPCGDAPHIIENGITGYIVPFGNISEFADRIGYLFENLESCINMGEKSHLKVHKNYSIKKYVENTLAAYSFFGLKNKIKS